MLYNIVVYVPETHLEAVKKAMFQAGGGKYQQYDSCSWQVAGTGQFRPLPGSTPFIGSQDTVETVTEYRVEMVCTEEHLDAVLAAMISAHPYEEVAHHFYGAMTASERR